MPERITAEQRIAAFQAEHNGCSPDPAEVRRWKSIDRKRAARDRERMAKTGSALDIPKRRKVASNPFSLAVARAKVLLDRGETRAAVRRATWLDDKTIKKIQNGELLNDLPVAALEMAKATEDGKLTLGAALCLDEIIENPRKLREATLQQLGTTAAILLDKREVLAGRPTSRVEHLHNLSETQLKDAMRDTYLELGARLKAQGIDVEDAEFEAQTSDL